ncbi:MAG: MBL fold metallo-hydrolase [Planctomycetota bacterium]
MIRALLTVLLNVGLVASSPLACDAETGKPVAIRWWGQGMVSIETAWGLTVVVDPHGGASEPNAARPDCDLVLFTHDHGDGSSMSAGNRKPFVFHGLDDDGVVRPPYQSLTRAVGEENPQWRRVRRRVPQANELRVKTIAAWRDSNEGQHRGAAAMFLIEADGVRVLYAGGLGQQRLTDAQLDSYRVVQATSPGTIDVLLLPVGGSDTIDGARAAAIVEQVTPRYVVPIHYKAEGLKAELATVDPFLDAIDKRHDVDRPKGNTLAVSAADGDDERSTRVVLLGHKPWRPTDELADLFERMETACTASQQIFAPLTAEQLNWRPPNGSHTARWNAEHMMGRQLGFFSQIYAAIDPEITAIDLNPAQMPPDYKPAHPDWDGAEQARQMERSAAFVRRFAYLLDGGDLDRRAPGSRWTPRRLLLQMERHFNQHTANVKKKFALPGWPQGEVGSKKAEVRSAGEGRE